MLKNIKPGTMLASDRALMLWHNNHSLAKTDLSPGTPFMVLVVGDGNGEGWRALGPDGPGHFMGPMRFLEGLSVWGS